MIVMLNLPNMSYLPGSYIVVHKAENILRCYDVRVTMQLVLLERLTQKLGKLYKDLWARREHYIN